MLKQGIMGAAIAAFALSSTRSFSGSGPAACILDSDAVHVACSVQVEGGIDSAGHFFIEDGTEMQNPNSSRHCDEVGIREFTGRLSVRTSNAGGDALASGLDGTILNNTDKGTFTMKHLSNLGSGFYQFEEIPEF